MIQSVVIMFDDIEKRRITKAARRPKKSIFFRLRDRGPSRVSSPALPLLCLYLYVRYYPHHNTQLLSLSLSL